MNILDKSNQNPQPIFPVWRGWTQTRSRYLGQPIWWHPKEGLAYEETQMGVLVDLPADAADTITVEVAG